MKVSILISILLAGVVAASAESFCGSLPKEQQDIIHYMAQHHAELVRKVTLTKTGYSAKTTTENKELVQKLHAHVTYAAAHQDLWKPHRPKSR